VKVGVNSVWFEHVNLGKSHILTAGASFALLCMYLSYLVHGFLGVVFMLDDNFYKRRRVSNNLHVGLNSQPYPGWALQNLGCQEIQPLLAVSARFFSI